MAILKENANNYQHTADAIAKQLGISYTKQAAEQRAKRIKLKETKEKEELIKIAKQRLREAVLQNNDGKLSVRIAKQILDNPKKYT